MRMQLGQSPVVGVEPAVYAPKALLLPSQYAATHPGHVYDGSSAASADADAREAHASLQRMKAEAPAVSTGMATGMATGMSGSMATPATTSMATSMAMSTAPAAPERKRKPAKREVFVCPEVHCGKQFPRSFALRRHMRIHTGTKPYACDYEGCAQRFNTSGNLSRHKRIHSGERPYPCVFETCGKRFNTSTKLKRHMRIHFPDGQNLFQCVEPGCAWACDNYKEYVQHQKLHSSVAQDDENGGGALANQPPRKKAKTAAKPKAVPASMSVPVPHAEEHGDPAAHDFHGHGVGLDAYAAAPAGLDFGEKDYYADRHRAYPLSAAPSTLLMMHKDAGREREDEYLPVDHRRAKSFLDERPRLPFPTRAFPSDSIAGPSVHGGIGSSFHFGSHLPPHRGPSYYDPPAPQQGGAGSPGAYHGGVSVSAAAYGGGYSSYVRSSSESLAASYAPPAQAYYGAEAQQSLQFAPIRPEEPPSDDRYESSPHATSQAMRAPGQGGPSDGYAGSGHGMTQPEFTGEELSAVLELMKDS